jgi:CBS domain-containing protein
VPEGSAVEIEILKEGIALRKKGKIEDALKKFDEALRLNPRSAAAYRERAIALQIVGEKDLAMREYKKALEIDPSLRIRKVGAAKRKEKGEEDRITTGYKVSDIMARDLISVPLGAMARDAAELMLRKNISSVAVREGNDIICIVTERDFVRNHHYMSGKDYAKIPIKDLVAYPLLAISADTSVEDASNQMAEQGIRHFLVRDGNDIVGLISLRDIVKIYSKLL